MREDDQQRDQDRPGPIGHGVETEDEPFGEEHDLRRHARDSSPVILIKERERDLGEHVGRHDSAFCEDRVSRSDHEWLVRRDARQFERKVGLDRRADFGWPAGIYRPATVW